MNAQTRKELLDGPVGKIEVSFDLPDLAAATAPAAGLALVAHPHPLFGGTMDNKVAQTLARVMVQLGYATVRPNFRGIGQTDGTHDRGIGEQDDTLAVIQHYQQQPAYQGRPLVLAGFSFGAFVAAQVARRLTEAGTPPHRLVLVGTPAGKWDVPAVAEDTIVIHGELDETIALSNVFEWARPQELPVIVVPGGEHFFHRKLHLLKRIIAPGWRV